jgi:hypothetical protein
MTFIGFVSFISPQTINLQLVSFIFPRSIIVLSMSFSPRRDLNNFIIRFFLSIYSYPFFGDYIIRQCYKIVINELFEGKKRMGKKTRNKIKENIITNASAGCFE